MNGIANVGWAFCERFRVSNLRKSGGTEWTTADTDDSQDWEMIAAVIVSIKWLQAKQIGPTQQVLSKAKLLCETIHQLHIPQILLFKRSLKC